jgi:hypothetical protein
VDVPLSVRRTTFLVSRIFGPGFPGRSVDVTSTSKTIQALPDMIPQELLGSLVAVQHTLKHPYQDAVGDAPMCYPTEKRWQYVLPHAILETKDDIATVDHPPAIGYWIGALSGAFSEIVQIREVGPKDLADH